jgi:simple sugar transport system substrate-binding protein
MERDAHAQAEAGQWCGKTVNRRAALGKAGKLTLAAAAFTAGLRRSQVPAAHSSSGLPNQPYRFIFINHMTSNAYFIPTKNGAASACKLLGCSFLWTGSETSDIGEMLKGMEAAIAAKVDGIAISIIDKLAFNGATAEALAAGIPVLAYNSDVAPDNKRLAYVGLDPYASGYNSAIKWLPMVKRGGRVMLAIATPGSLNLQPRLDGFLKAIDDAGNPVKYDIVATGPLLGGMLSTVEAYYLSHPKVVGLFGISGEDTLACGQVTMRYGLAAKGVITAGYDLLPQTLTLIASGSVAFCAYDQPYLQGLQPVLQLYLYQLSNSTMYPVDTDTVTYVTKQNWSKYRALGQSE